VRICLLDDDLAQLNLLGLWLANANHTPVQFSSGRSLMSSLRQQGYDLFVLDWSVPDLDGTEVLRRIRLQLGESVPVIFVTQRDFEEDVVEVLNAGADDYLVKPVRKGIFLARVDALFRRGRIRFLMSPVSACGFGLFGDCFSCSNVYVPEFHPKGLGGAMNISGTLRVCCARILRAKTGTCGKAGIQ